MENKAPGTEPRPGGYGTSGGGSGHDNFFKPRMKMKGNMQRVALRTTYRVGLLFSAFVVGIIIIPSYIGPLYVQYVAQSDWMERATKTIWTRRNEKEFTTYMTQRKNTWTELLGLKQYNIGGDDNAGDIQKYR